MSDGGKVSQKSRNFSILELVLSVRPPIRFNISFSVSGISHREAEEGLADPTLEHLLMTWKILSVQLFVSESVTQINQLLGCRLEPVASMPSTIPHWYY